MGNFNDYDGVKEVAIPENFELKPGEIYWDGGKQVGIITEVHIRRWVHSMVLIMSYERFDNKETGHTIMGMPISKFEAIYNV